MHLDDRGSTINPTETKIRARSARTFRGINESHVLTPKLDDVRERWWGGEEGRTRRATVRSDKNCLSKRRNLVPLVYVSRYLLVSLLDSWLPCTLEMTVHYRETWTKIAFRYGAGGQGGGEISIYKNIRWSCSLVRTIIVFLPFFSFSFSFFFLLVSVDQQKNVGVCDRCPVTERARRS